MATQTAVVEFVDTVDGDLPMEGNQATILIVDDENGPRQALRMLLKEEYRVLTADGVAAAMAFLEHEVIDLIITDLRMPDQSGIDLLRHVRERFPGAEVIILTGYGQLGTAVQAMDFGAFAYMEKPFDNNQMLARVRASLAKRREMLEHRALEELAFQANRFETLGRLVTGTMHDLGTPLSVIGTHIEMLLRNPDRPDLDARLKTMSAQVDHCTDIVRTTMNYLRQTPGKRTPYSLNTVATACLDVARPILTKQEILTEMTLDPDLPMLTGEIALVRQAVLNLVTNASQAMQGMPAPRVIRVHSWQEPGWVCLSVEDNGPGIPKEFRFRIFDALFTTKAERGTGLGLSVVKHVMEHHGGDVTFEEPDNGVGARFVLRFPVV